LQKIVHERERPTIPKSCPPSLASLIRSCWQHEASLRPSFERIVHLLNEIIVDVAIQDEKGREFWKENFLSQVSELLLFFFLNLNLNA
jgi:hypothetical protein